jgi:hypothetical protein
MAAAGAVSMFTEADLTEDDNDDDDDNEKVSNNNNEDIDRDEDEPMDDSSATEMEMEEEEDEGDDGIGESATADQMKEDGDGDGDDDDLWRLREMGDTILFADRPNNNKNKNDDPMMIGPPWRRFTAASVDKIRLPGVVVVQRAFDAAAATVLQAILSGHKDDDEEDAAPHKLSSPSAALSSDQLESWRKHLPAEFAKDDGHHHGSTTTTLSDLRIAALEHVWVARGESVGGTTTIAATTTVGGGHAGKKTFAAASATTPTTAATAAASPTTTSTTTIRQFTRNTPASTAASLDARLHHGRAVLAAAANLVVSALTPGYNNGDGKIDALYGLTKDNRGNDDDDDEDSSSGGAAANNRMVHNWNAVVVEAQTHADRCLAVTANAIRRSTQRREYRMNY